MIHEDSWRHYASVPESSISALRIRWQNDEWQHARQNANIDALPARLEGRGLHAEV
jgi:hypothetical protein